MRRLDAWTPGRSDPPRTDQGMSAQAAIENALDGGAPIAAGIRNTGRRIRDRGLNDQRLQDVDLDAMSGNELQ